MRLVAAADLCRQLLEAVGQHVGIGAALQDSLHRPGHLDVELPVVELDHIDASTLELPLQQPDRLWTAHRSEHDVDTIDHVLDVDHPCIEQLRQPLAGRGLQRQRGDDGEALRHHFHRVVPFHAHPARSIPADPT